MRSPRKKTWQEKVDEVKLSIERVHLNEVFAKNFYINLFFLNPTLREKFNNTDWEHQHKAIIFGIDHLINFFDSNDEFHRSQVIRIAQTHSKNNLDIHPHNYYYWIEALIMTVKKVDSDWYDDLEYYFRECLFFPITFITSLYHK
jgi:hemoglobin-like flavoprotein